MNNEPQSATIRLGYDSLNILQQYWYGMGDPLYALLSRRGNSVDFVTVSVSIEELKRLRDVCAEIRDNDKSEPSHIRVANTYAERTNRAYIWRYGRKKFNEEFALE